MIKDEKNFLKEMIDCPSGLLSHDDLFRILGKSKSGKTIQRLIGSGHIDEVYQKYPTPRGQVEIACYRVSEKGLAIFLPWYRKMWHVFRGDVRTVLVSVITAIIISIATIYITNLFGK
jgi:hypothetical protein